MPALQFGKSIRAKESLHFYALEPNVIELCTFLKDNIRSITSIDPIRFIIEEIFVQGTHRRPADKNVHTRLVDRTGFDSEDELPPTYRRFYELLKNIFSSSQAQITLAFPYIVERLAAVVFELKHSCNARTHCKFYVNGSSKSIRFDYMDRDGVKHFLEDVDVVTVPNDPADTHHLGECKSGVRGFVEVANNSYKFLDLLSTLIEEPGGRNAAIVFIFPLDNSKVFPSIISKVTRSRPVFALNLIEWNGQLERY